MKYIKHFENAEDGYFSIGDYVIAKESSTIKEDAMDFFRNRVGQVVERDGPHLIVQYHNAPKEFIERFFHTNHRLNIPKTDTAFPFSYYELRHATDEEIDIQNKVKTYNL